MRQSPDFILCDVADNHILMPVGEATVNLNGMITLNEMGLTIWKKLEEEVSFEGILNAILEEYDINEAKARAGIEVFLKTLRNAGCILE